MNHRLATTLRGQLTDRQLRLRNAISHTSHAEDLLELLHEVDSALGRLEAEGPQTCEVCGEEVQEELVEVHPMIRYCLCDLSEAQQAALERDLGLARRTQLALLPAQDLSVAGWEVHFRYQPAGPVSGDYLDVVVPAPTSPYFFLGDVSGKGVAASLLMARLSGLTRTLIEQGLPLNELMARADRFFAENSPSSHFATLVAVRADGDGGLSICNAGHCPPLVLRDGSATPMEAGGLPVGIGGGDEPHTVHTLEFARGDTLFMYTDGLTEAMDGDRKQYGSRRLTGLLQGIRDASPSALAAACLADQAEFLRGATRHDDLSLMVVRRVG